MTAGVERHGASRRPFDAAQCVSLAALIFALGWARGEPLVQIVLTSIALAVAPTWPKQTLSTTTFEEVMAEGTGAVGVKTMLTLRWEPYEATQEEIDTFNAGRVDGQQSSDVRTNVARRG